MPVGPIGHPWASRQQVGHLSASRTACGISIPLAAQTAAKQLSLNLAAATCHILKRTQGNPLCLSRNNPIACTRADRPITRRGSTQASTRTGSELWPVCTAASGLTHSATRAGPYSWSSTIVYQHHPSTNIDSVLHVLFTCLTVLLHNLCPSPLFFYVLIWNTALHSPSFFTQSLSSFHKTCPYHHNLFCCSTEM